MTASLIALICFIGTSGIGGEPNTVSKLIYPANDNCDRTESPKHTFVIESYGVGPDHNWIVKRSGGKIIAIPLPPPQHRGDLCGYLFNISPDEEWILVDQKLYHGANALWLYHREKQLHYSLVFPSFSEEAWKYFEKSTNQKFELDNTFIIRSGPWPAKNNMLRFTLYGASSTGVEADWAFCFDLAARRFMPSKDQTTSYVPK